MTLAFVSIGKMTLSSVDQIISRMIIAADAKNQQELIEKTGLSDGIASKWRKRGKVPDSGIFKVAQMTKVSFEWLKTGEGEMLVSNGLPKGKEKYAEATNEQPGGYRTAQALTLTPDELELISLYRQADPPRQRHLIECARIVADATSARVESQGNGGGECDSAKKKSA